jgi:hypothetical protein
MGRADRCIFLQIDLSVRVHHPDHSYCCYLPRRLLLAHVLLTNQPDNVLMWRYGCELLHDMRQDIRTANGQPYCSKLHHDDGGRFGLNGDHTTFRRSEYRLLHYVQLAMRGEPTRLCFDYRAIQQR